VETGFLTDFVKKSKKMKIFFNFLIDLSSFYLSSILQNKKDTHPNNYNKKYEQNTVD